jgi:hypothetical protein
MSVKCLVLVIVIVIVLVLLLVVVLRPRLGIKVTMDDGRMGVSA